MVSYLFIYLDRLKTEIDNIIQMRGNETLISVSILYTTTTTNKNNNNNNLLLLDDEDDILKNS